MVEGVGRVRPLAGQQGGKFIERGDFGGAGAQSCSRTVARSSSVAVASSCASTRWR